MQKIQIELDQMKTFQLIDEPFILLGMELITKFIFSMIPILEFTIFEI